MALSFNGSNHTSELFTKLVKEIVHVHDWLAGPGMTEHDRLEREIAETEGLRRSFK